MFNPDQNRLAPTLAMIMAASLVGFITGYTVPLISLELAQQQIAPLYVGLLAALPPAGMMISSFLSPALCRRVEMGVLLSGSLILLALATIASCMTTDMTLLLLPRLLTGLAHGVFFSIGSTIATSLVAKEKAASAIAIMFGGLTVALVTGVPFGTFIGQHFGWRETFLAVSILGVIALISSLILVPNNIPGRASASASLRDQMKVLTHPRLLMIYAITALGYGGVFTAFTFLAPMMQELAGFSPSAVSWILLGYGVSVAIGNVWGGKLADKHGAVSALKFIFAALVVLLLVFQLTASVHYAALATVLVMGVFAFGNVPGLQVYVVQKAEQYTPGAVDIASGLNIAAFNVGIALGSIVGGQTVERYGLAQTPWIGAVIVLVALLLVVLSGRLDKSPRRSAALSPEG